MIIVQTPLRISFFGRGTDFSSFFTEEGGCVLSSAIDKYIFLVIKQRFDAKLRVGYTRTEMVDGVLTRIHTEIKTGNIANALKPDQLLQDAGIAIAHFQRDAELALPVGRGNSRARNESCFPVTLPADFAV